MIDSKEATIIRKELHQMGLDSRNLDRSRRRALKRLCRGDIGTGHLLIPVPDPEQLDKEAKLARAQL